MGKFLRLVVFAAVAASACAGIGGGGALDWDALRFRCGSAALPPATEVAELATINEETLANAVGAGAASRLDLDGEWLGSAVFYEVERTADTYVVLGERTGSPTGTEAYFDASFRRFDGTWRLSSWGDCWMVVDAGDEFGPAEIRFDQRSEPDDTSTELRLFAEELACAGGELPEGRDVETLVAETNDVVEVLVLVRVSPGPQKCPGNPSFPVVVALERPLGERTVLDGGSAPPRRLCCSAS